MTFRLEDHRISDEEAHRLLRVLKSTRSNISHTTLLRVRPDMTLGQADAFLRRVAEAGLLLQQADWGVFTRTEAGTSMEVSGLQPRIGRAEVDLAITKALDAARAWNIKKDVPVDIISLAIFGSALEDRPDYGDVDIALTVRLRSNDNAEIEAWIEGLPKSMKQGIYGFLGESSLKEYWERKAIHHIDKAHDHISATSDNVFRRTGCDWMEIYAFNPESRTEIAPDRVHHPRTRPREDHKPVAPLATRPLHIARDLGAPPQKGVSRRELTTEELGALARRCSRTHGETGKDKRPVPSDRALLFAEGFPAWVLHPDERPSDPAEDYAALRNILREAQARGLLSEEIEVGVSLSRKSIHLNLVCLLDGYDTHAFNIALEFDGTRPSLQIYPTVQTYMPGAHAFGEGLVTDGRFVSLARSLVIPMRNIQSRFRLPARVEGDVSFFWNPAGNSAPKIPSLSRVAKVMKPQRPFLTETQVAAILAHAAAAPKGSSIFIEIAFKFAIEVFGEGVAKVAGAGIVTDDVGEEDVEVLQHSGSLEIDNWIEGPASRAYALPSIEVTILHGDIGSGHDQRVDVPGYPEEMLRAPLELEAVGAHFLSQISDMGFSPNLDVVVRAKALIYKDAVDVTEAWLRAALAEKEVPVVP